MDALRLLIRFLFYNLFRLITLKAAFMAKLVAVLCTFLSFLLFAFLEKSVGGLTKLLSYYSSESILITHLSLNSNMGFQVYIRDLFFRYVISKVRNV